MFTCSYVVQVKNLAQNKGFFRRKLIFVHTRTFSCPNFNQDAANSTLTNKLCFIAFIIFFSENVSIKLAKELQL